MRINIEGLVGSNALSCYLSILVVGLVGINVLSRYLFILVVGLMRSYIHPRVVRSLRRNFYVSIVEHS